MAPALRAMCMFSKKFLYRPKNKKDCFFSSLFYFFAKIYLYIDYAGKLINVGATLRGRRYKS